MNEPSLTNRDVANRTRRGLGQKALDLYFRPKRVEKWKEGRLYELLGIKMVKKVCVYIGRKFGWEFYFIGDRSQEGLMAYEKRTRINEAKHSPLAVLLTYEIISVFVEGNYAGVLIVGPIWLLKALPAALQRYNRVKVNSVLHRMASRTDAVEVLDA